ncbi:hypothetical protein Bca4012_033838 [Brassica carinata]
MLEIRFDEEDPSTPSIDIRSVHLKEIRFDVVFFRDTEIAREQVLSFTQGSRKVRLQRIQMISESVFLNVNQTEELKTQTMKDHVHLKLRTLIRVRGTAQQNTDEDISQNLNMLLVIVNRFQY